jgi:hypothetical protein
MTPTPQDLARRIPNHPHPDRARAVHEWAQSMLRVIRETPIERIPH